MCRKDNASASHLFCTGINDQSGAGKTMESKIPMKWEINPDSHPKAYYHAAWMESCYTITPAPFSIFAAQPPNCGCIAHQALYTCGKGKIWPYIIRVPLHTTQRHTSHFLYRIHNLQRIFYKQLKISTVQTENYICQSVLFPRLKSRFTLTRDFAATSMPYNYSLENVAQDTFFPFPCKNYSTTKH